MICEICKSNPTLFSEADRERLDAEKWEQRRYEIAKEILPNSIDHMRNLFRLTSDVASMAVEMSIDISNELIRQLKE